MLSLFDYGTSKAHIQINNNDDNVGDNQASNHGGITIGAYPNDAYCSNVNITEIIVMNNIATAEELNNVRAYVHSRYNIAMWW